MYTTSPVSVAEFCKYHNNESRLDCQFSCIEILRVKLCVQYAAAYWKNQRAVSIYIADKCPSIGQIERKKSKEKIKRKKE